MVPCLVGHPRVKQTCQKCLLVGMWPQALLTQLGREGPVQNPWQEARKDTGRKPFRAILQLLFH